MKILYLFLIALLTVACAPIPKPPSVPEPVQYVLVKNPADTALSAHEIIPITGFNEIIFSGPIYAEVNGQQLHSQITVKGTVESLKAFSTKVNKGVLYIHAVKPLMVSVNLEHPVRKLAYQGTGQLFIKNMDNQPLNLSLSGNSKVHLTGSLVLSQLNLSDQALLYAYWVNSSHLRIHAGDNAKLFLAGIVTQLDINAKGKADIEAKYLHADNAYVQTRDYANVSVSVKRSLSAISADKSTIYKHRDSRASMQYLGCSGSALRMIGIHNENTGYRNFLR